MPLGRRANATARLTTAALLGALLAGVIGSLPATASPTCRTSGPGDGSYAVEVCLEAPTSGETVAGTIEVAASATTTGNSIRLLQFALSGEYVLSDFHSPYRFRLPTARWIDGSYTLSVVAHMKDGFTTSATSIGLRFSNGVTTIPSPSSFTPRTGRPADGGPFVVAAVGDAAGGHPRSAQLSNMVTGWNPNLFLYLGDVYERGTFTEFLNYYGTSSSLWGRLRAVTNPTPGNHDNSFQGGAGYRAYWNGPPPFYSVDTHGWHIVSLNTNVSAATSSLQYSWLEQDLAASDAACTLVFLHDPRYTQSSYGDDNRLVDVWRLMHAEGVDIVLAGHNHSYERWKPLDATGDATTGEGITQFVVGTGGHTLHRFSRSDPRVARSFDTAPDSIGALRLTLGSSSADFAYTNIEGAVRDSGTVGCGNGGDGGGGGGGGGGGTEPPPTSSFQDDFESGTLASWTSVKGDVAVVSGDATSGTDAARLSSTQAAPASLIRQLDGGYPEVRAAMWFKLVGDPPGYVNLIRMKRSAGGNVASLFVNPSGQLMVRNDVEGTNMWSLTPVTSDVWHRVEFRTKVAGDASEVEVWFDGVRQANLSRILSLGSSSLGRVMIGDSVDGNVSTTLVDDVGIVASGSGTTDVTAPTAPTGLTATSVAATSVALAWSPSGDDVGVVGYDVYRDGQRIAAQVPGTTFVDETVTPSTSSTYRVRAVDGAGNESAASNAVSVTTPAEGGVVFSDGFEGGDLSAWSRVRGAFGITDGDRRTGSFAGIARSDFTTTASVVRDLPASSDLTTRVSFRVVERFGTSVQLVRLQAADTTDLLTAFVSKTTGSLMIRVDTDGSTLWSSAAVADGAWHDLVVRARIAGGSSQVEVWLDGAKLSSLSKTVPLGTTPAARLVVGDEVLSHASTVVFDDVAVSTAS